MMQNCKNYSISRKKKTYFCTNFFAMRFLYLDQVDSTNAYLLRFPEQERIGTVVWTHEQTAGKGMATNTWESTPGLNLTFSKLLQVSVFPNLALVFVFYTTDTWKLSKGVLVGAMPYIIAAIALSF